MHEKYNALEADRTRSKGGEYEHETGFDWSNGVALKMMKTYRTVSKSRTVIPSHRQRRCNIPPPESAGDVVFSSLVPMQKAVPNYLAYSLC